MMLPSPTSFPQLPPAPQPPHDPTFWLLAARPGWRAADLRDVTVSGDKLTLQVLAGSGRRFEEPSGSFGGLIPPGHVAVASDGSIWLLDARAGTLKRFDPCDCAFQTVPCLGGPGSAPRQVSDPHGIGICSGNLFVCDTGNHRVQVFMLRGMVLRAIWSSPIADWQPYAIAFDQRGRVYVSDPANACIHRFSPAGHWQRKLDGFAGVQWIAIDCQNRLYAVAPSSSTVKITDLEGKPLGVASRPEEVSHLFPPLPFIVDAQGNLKLGDLCTPPQSPGVFGQGGDPVAHAPADPPPAFKGSGTFWSDALDSGIYRCQWHRIVLSGQVPRKTAAFVSTFTSEVAQTLDQIQALPDDAWKTNLLVTEIRDQWDGLIAGTRGRYLWIRVLLSGDGSATPSITCMRIEYPRIGLTRYLPGVFEEDPNGAEFTGRFLSIFDTGFRGLEERLDREAGYFDPLSAPAGPGVQNDFLTWLASWIGVSLDRNWSIDQRRQFLKLAGRLQGIRGTRFGLWQQLLILLGMRPEDICCPSSKPKQSCSPKPLNCAPADTGYCAWQPPPLLLENYQLRRWLFLGAGTLGDRAVLWGQRIVNRSQLGANAQAGVSRLTTTPDPLHDPFLVYSHKFTVFVPACFGADAKKKRSLLNLLESEKPAHTHYQLEYVAPRMRIGVQSMIGLDAVIGRYPEGFYLGQKLGGASVLSGSPVDEGHTTFQVGRTSRIGPGARVA